MFTGEVLEPVVVNKIPSFVGRSNVKIRLTLQDAKWGMYFLAFVLPYTIIYIVDFIVIGKRWYLSGTDSIPGIAGAGWSWFNFHPLLFDHPAYFLHLLSALFIL
jgi:hypothetical protein